MSRAMRFLPRKIFAIVPGLILACLFASDAMAQGVGVSVGGHGFSVSGFFSGAGASISIAFGAFFGGSCSGAPSVGEAICNVIASATWVPGLITAIAYLAGLAFGILGILKLKDHVLNPDRAPLSDALKHFLAGGCLFALPIVTEALHNSIVGAGMFGGGLESQIYSGFGGRTSGYGLDAALVYFIKDIWWPMHDLLGGFAYIAGLALTVIGIMRIVKSSQEGARGPTGLGTIMTFATAAALFSLDSLMGAFSFSMFGDTMTTTAPYLMYTDGMTAEEVNHVRAVISAIIAFVALVGWVSFIRGWFIVRGVAEGNSQASLMAAITHIFGGALAVNLGPLLNAVQYTLGLDGFGVMFS